MLTCLRTESIATQFSIITPSPLQKIEAAWTRFFIGDSRKKVEVWCKRDDLLHGVIAGNKWRKLAKPLQEFQLNRASHVLSFGGPYSNHLHALGYCCNQLNIKFTAVIRGAYLKDQAFNRTLQDLNNWNANLVFVDKITYQHKTDENYLATLRKKMSADVIIPEGGSQQDALVGMQAMLDEINMANSSRPFDAILLPVGSGASMAGVIENCSSKLAKQIIGIGVLQGEGYLEGLVNQFLNKDTPHLPWHINHQFHFGGYAKSTVELKTFCKEVNQQQAKQDIPIRIEQVYSGECFLALKTLIQQRYCDPNSKILIIHTGGLQGAR